MNRLRLALHVLRGRPLAYRIEIKNGALIIDEHTRIQDAMFSSLDHLRFRSEVAE